MKVGQRTRCVISNCITNSAPSDSIKFHYFPKDSVRCSEWMNFCQVGTTQAIDRVCGRHFTDEDYLDAGRILGRPRKEWVLKRDAVPSQSSPDTMFLQEEQLMEVESAEVEEVEEEDLEGHPIPSFDNIVVEFTDPNEEETLYAEAIEEVIEHQYSIGICRLCLRSVDAAEDHLANLFEATEGGPSESLPKFLFQLFQIELEDSPEWPTIACNSCVSFIGNMKEFQSMILSSHGQLYHQLVTDKQLQAQVEIELELEASEAAAAAASADAAEAAATADDDLIEEKRPRKLHVHTPKPPRDPEKDRLLEQHLLEWGLLNCAICGAHEESSDTFGAHMRRHHDVQHPQIDCCGKKFKLGIDSLDHMEFHLDTDAFKCATCEKTYQNSSALQRHQKYAHAESDNMLACPTCSRQFPKEAMLRKHMLVHLPKDKRPFLCNSCPARFVGKHALQRHVERMHDVKERHACELCGKGFSNYANYYDHKSRSHQEAQECPVCHKKFKHLSAHLKQHLDGEVRPKSRPKPIIPTMEGEELFKCPICSEEHGKEAMRQHSLVHVKGGVKAPYCHICMIRIRGGGYHKEHMDRHKGVQYPCEYCPGDKPVVYSKYQSWYLHVKSRHKQIYNDTIAVKKKKTIKSTD